MLINSRRAGRCSPSTRGRIAKLAFITFSTGMLIESGTGSALCASREILRVGTFAAQMLPLTAKL
jgi:hypothetical protein